VKIEVHDVDHGGCAVIMTPNGKRVMLDCGVNHSRPWYPSVEFHGQRIDLLFLMNLDEDHVEDLPYLWNSSPLGSVFSNPTIPAPTLDRIKAKGMRPGVRKAHDILAQFGAGMMGWPPADLGGVTINWFWNRYGLPHTDTNNLSLAVFVEYGAFSILFGGDMETAGWRSLQAIPGFNDRLRRVKVYVASHHGRKNGQCEEIFDHCRPEVILLSDGPKQYVSQETNNWYRTRATGIPEIDRPEGLLGRPRRYAMTTRRDGTMTIDVAADGKFLVRSEKAVSNPLSDLAAFAALSPEPYMPALPTTTPNAFAGLGGIERFWAPPAPTPNALAGLSGIDRFLAPTPPYLPPGSALDNALLRTTPTNALSALASLTRK
jgi:beta-lactamase superfamily II metal-dependent hydrolase